MITYTATATESEGWWTLQCVEVPGAISQVRELHQAESMIREAIAFVLGQPEATIDLAAITISGHSTRNSLFG